ncbi:MAG: right-handed parallel beta-helix repeat-containing protein [Kiritimatiellae bacterium]|nr:right-handed parallel beta-helix repeat-containing protein [Kiritimatiellia bacterium]
MRKTIHLLLTAMAAVCLITDSAAGALMTLHSEALQPDGSIRLKVGETPKIEVRLDGQPAGNTRFESGNPGFFSVDNAGVLKGVHEGVTLLKVEAGEQSASPMVFVGSPEAVATPMGAGMRRAVVRGILAANEGGEVPVGRVERIIAHLLPYETVGANPFSIASSDPAVVRVDDAGKIIEALRPGRATVMVSTLDGKFRDAVAYQVVALAAPAPVKALMVDPKRFGLVYDVADEASAKANSAGLQAALDFAGSNEMNRVVLEKGKTLFIEPRDGIHMVSGVTFDLNGSELRLRPNDYPSYAALLFASRKGAARPVENAAIVNGTITGERDEKEAHFPNWAGTPATEGSCSIFFGEGRNNGISNLVVRKSIGFNMSSGNGMSAPGSAHFASRPLGVRNMELGAFDAKGNPIDEPARIRSTQPIDLAGLKTDFYVVGYPLGYQGYPYVNSRIYDVCFYDADQKFLGLERGRFRNRKYAIPQGAVSARFSFYHPEVPTAGNSDFHGGFAFVHNPQLPDGNFIVDCVIEDNYSCGFAACGGQRWVIRNNVFRRNGGRMPGCDIDWEDGWEYMQGDLIEGNSFESRVNVITCAGAGFVFRGNTFRGHTIFYGRTQHYSFIGNTVIPGDSGFKTAVSFNGQTDFYASGNVYREARIDFGREHVKLPGADYRGRLVGETFERSHVNGGVALTEFTDCMFIGASNALALSGATFSGCTIRGGAWDASGSFKNTNVESASFRVNRNALLDFESCTLVNPEFASSSASVGLRLDRCRVLVDKPCTFTSPSNMARIAISRSEITLGAGAAPFILAGGWNAKGVATQIDLVDVTFKEEQPVEGFLHKFPWNAPKDDPVKMIYTLTRTKLPKGISLTDEKGKAGNTVFNLKP